MEILPLHFTGPFTFTPGPACLYESEVRESPCVYLWTIRSDRDARYYIHYVGEAQAFARRQREHLIRILGLEYGVYDAAAAGGGILKPLWPGLWRMRDIGEATRALEQYPQLTGAVMDYVAALAVFAAPVAGEHKLRRDIEGAIGWNLRRNHPDCCLIYPDDNRVCRGAAKRGLCLQITADRPVAGLDPMIEL